MSDVNEWAKTRVSFNHEQPEFTDAGYFFAMVGDRLAKHRDRPPVKRTSNSCTVRIVSLGREKFPALRCRCGVNPLHCRSPFYLCLEQVDNLGAYRIPSETGLLLPSASIT